MSHLGRLLLFACLVVPVSPIPARDTGGTGPDSASGPKDRSLSPLIAQLGSKQLAEREQAAQLLNALGEPAIEALRAAAVGHPDAEVRGQAGALAEIIANRREQAQTFARQTISIIQTVRRDSVADVGQDELLAWAIEGLYRGVGRQVPPPIIDRLARAADLNEEEARALLRDARRSLAHWTELPKGKDFERAAKAMLARFDPYADLLAPESLGRFSQRPPDGIGIRLDTRPSIWPRVVTPIKDGPAHQAGIQAGDFITQVIQRVDSAGQPLKHPHEIETEGMLPADLERMLLGKAGTNVHLMIRRKGAAQPVKVEVTRGAVQPETVLGSRRKNDNSWDYLLDAENRIGYVRLTAFSRPTAAGLHQAVDELTRHGLRGLILDLRSNPGGLLWSAVAVADLFTDDGLIVSLRPREGQGDDYRGKKEGSRLDFPMVCLIDRDTASSAEVVAACLQDHRRAVIMGERSRGRASAQNIQPFGAARSELMLTIAMFYRPNGRKLDRIRLTGRDADERGVLPDRGFALELPAVERVGLLDYLNRLDGIPPPGGKKETGPVFRDRQLDLALAYLRSTHNP
jgi:C-terminal peptidase prc